MPPAPRMQKEPQEQTSYGFWTSVERLPMGVGFDGITSVAT